MFNPPHPGASLGVTVLTVLALGACGGPTSPERTASPGVPVHDAVRPGTEAVNAIGRQIYGAVIAAEPALLLVDDEGMRHLVDDEAAERYSALRFGVGSRVGHVQPDAFEGSHYVGVCLQGARLEPVASRLGLRAPAWVFERALVAAEMPTGRRVASWVEGLFVQTEQGFVAIDLHSVEDPRWEHTDLEIASCDMEAGIQYPQDVGMATP